MLTNSILFANNLKIWLNALKNKECKQKKCKHPFKIQKSEVEYVLYYWRYAQRIY